jgi:hypothetical protein
MKLKDRAEIVRKIENKDIYGGMAEAIEVLNTIDCYISPVNIETTKDFIEDKSHAKMITLSPESFNLIKHNETIYNIVEDRTYLKGRRVLTLVEI